MIKVSQETARRIFADMTAASISDDRLNLLANRFQANQILQLMGITFGEYLDSPQKFDRIAAHLASGGGCRVVAGNYHIQEARHAG